MTINELATCQLFQQSKAGSFITRVDNLPARQDEVSVSFVAWWTWPEKQKANVVRESYYN
jgi:hypothetical protein